MTILDAWNAAKQYTDTLTHSQKMIFPIVSKNLKDMKLQVPPYVIDRFEYFAETKTELLGMEARYGANYSASFSEVMKSARPLAKDMNLRIQEICSGLHLMDSENVLVARVCRSSFSAADCKTFKEIGSLYGLKSDC